MLTELRCDRCHQKFQGFMIEEFTAGCYLRQGKQYNGQTWGEWMVEQENVICDTCMHRDIRYVSRYGPLPKKEVE